MDENAQREADLALVKAHANQLLENFDSVQIFCTRPNQDKEGGTINLNYGLGDFFARYGKVRAWVLREEEAFRCEGRRMED